MSEERLLLVSNHRNQNFPSKTTYIEFVIVSGMGSRWKFIARSSRGTFWSLHDSSYLSYRSYYETNIRIIYIYIYMRPSCTAKRTMPLGFYDFFLKLFNYK